MICTAEIWKAVVGFESRYLVSNLGRVKSILQNKIMKQQLSHLGYYRISFDVNYVNHTCRVHRLVAEAFLPNPDNKEFVNHINGDRKDNRLENLEWVTNRENVSHKYITTNKASRYVGVTKSNGKWNASIQINKKRINIGTFNCEHEAGYAYAKTLEKYGLSNKYSKSINN